MLLNLKSIKINFVELNLQIPNFHVASQTYNSYNISVFHPRLQSSPVQSSPVQSSKYSMPGLGDKIAGINYILNFSTIIWHRARKLRRIEKDGHFLSLE